MLISLQFESFEVRSVWAKFSEIIAVVTAEVISDINFMEIEENCIYSLEPISKLDNLISWVYVRKEN